MELRIIPKVLLWSMLTISTLGTISSLVGPYKDQTIMIDQESLKQQMAVNTAVNFAREWMTWSGDEVPEDRLNRLKPYVNPAVLSRVGPIQTEQRTTQQKAIAAEFISSTVQDAHQVTVRVRVIVMNPARTVWEIDIPVWVQLDKGASVTAPPVIRPLQEPPTVLESTGSELTASSSTKERMRPAIESFLKAMCEGKDAGSLLNFVRTGSKLTPLLGRIHLISLDNLEASGTGPSYIVTVTFTAKDSVSGVSFPQVWKLAVTEENQKFFVGAIHP